MHKLPSNVDLKFLLDATLLQVCVGAYEVILNFDDDISITVESSFVLGAVGGDRERFDQFPTAAQALAGLLHMRVTQVKYKTDSNLYLQFSDGFEVEVDGGDPAYECYLIRHGEREFVV
jgi:hypothetical protein